MKTVTCFLGADMRSGHDGLTKLAGTKNVDLKNLNTGEAVVFINRRRDKMKAYSYNHVLSYYRSPDSTRPISMDSIEMFPKAFNEDGSMDYSKALRAALEKKLKGRDLKEIVIGKSG